MDLNDITLVCDKCKQKITGIFEVQEALKFRFTGGYGSVFGDGTHVEANICQHCIKEFLNNVDYRTEEYW